MKQLKDYLHYYLYGNIYEVGVSTSQLIGIGDCYYTIKTKQGNPLTLSDRAEIKLVLRRLEDMTEGDLKEMITRLSLIDLSGCEFEYDQYWVNAIRKGVVVDCLSIEMNGQIDMMHYTHATNPQAEAFHYLLSKGFDLFGLIDAGLAIDAKTLTP